MKKFFVSIIVLAMLITNVATVFAGEAFSDDFDSGTQSDSWVEVAGEWIVEDGMYIGNWGSWLDGVAVSDQKYDDFDLSYKFKILDDDKTGWMGTLIRKKRETADFTYGGILILVQDNAIAMQDVVDGATVQAETGINIHDDFVDLKIETRGSTIKAYLNDMTTPVLEWEYDGYLGDDFGYVSLQNGFVKVAVDDFSITPYVDKTTSPQTGDSQNIILYGILILISLAMIVVISKKKVTE